MITGSFTTAYGTVSVQIDAGASARTAEIVDIGSIKYEFDITPDQVEITRLMAIYTRLDVTWFAYAVDGTDLYEILSVLTSPADVTVTVTGYDGTVSVFPFNLQAFDVALSERDQTIKTSFGVFVDNTPTIADVWDEIVLNHSGDIFTFHATGINHDAVSAKKWIEVAGQMILGNQTNTQFFSGETNAVGYYDEVYSDIDPTDPAQNELVGTVAIDVTGFKRGGTDADLGLAIDTLQTLAGYEGGVFGAGFSSVFYVNRKNNTATTVTLTYDEVLDLSFTRNYKAYRNIILGSLNTVFDSPNNHIPNIPDADVDSGTLNPSAEKSILIRLEAGYPVLNISETDFANTRVNALSGTDLDNANALYLGVGLDSYELALPATGALTIETTLYGFGRVKPWEVFEFDSTVPARYQFKTFRINSVEYDMKSNTTKIRAYEVT